MRGMTVGLALGLAVACGTVTDGSGSAGPPPPLPARRVLLPPMGMRVRLKAGVSLSGFPADVRVILTALKTYGMLLADNGGAFYLSGAPDPRWNDADIEAMKRLRGRDFEVVKMTGLVVP